MIQLGQHPPANHVIAHLSDTHLLGGGRALYGRIDTERTAARAIEQLERAGQRAEAIVITGDLTDLGEPDAYARLKDMVEPAAARIGAQVIWVMGNHDERAAYSVGLFGAASEEPQDRVYDVNGLRIVALDTSVPGYHHGELTDGQLEWLADVLSTPAPDGTLLALHHPPIPTPIEVMALIELQEQHRLAEVIRGTDVRGVLAGHLHYATTGMFAGVPVSVAAATCYTIDLSGPAESLVGIDGGQTFNLVHVYDDQVVHSVVPVGQVDPLFAFSDVVLERLAAMSPEQRLEAFSNKKSDFNIADAEASAGA